MTTSFDFFNYLDNELYCEDVKVKEIVEKVGTPAYIYSKNSILEHFIEIRNAFEVYGYSWYAWRYDGNDKYR